MTLSKAHISSMPYTCTLPYLKSICPHVYQVAIQMDTLYQMPLELNSNFLILCHTSNYTLVILLMDYLLLVDRQRDIRTKTYTCTSSGKGNETRKQDQYSPTSVQDWMWRSEGELEQSMALIKKLYQHGPFITRLMLGLQTVH